MREEMAKRVSTRIWNCEGFNRPKVTRTAKTQSFGNKKKMGFLKCLKDVASGRIARSNRLIGNHGVRICEKLEIHANPLLEALIGGTAVCTIEFLEVVLFDVKDFKYKDGTEEPNPFKENIKQLNEKTSYEMFKLVAGNYLVRLIGGEYLDIVEDLIDIPKLKKEFLNIYEYNEGDTKIFNELLELAQKDERPSPELRLFDSIFERVYNIASPVALFHIINFELLFRDSFTKIFLPGLLDVLKKENRERAH